MISQTAEYALRATVWLAINPNKSLTTQEIATATQVPARYLSKVLQALSRAGIVAAQRGLHGGFVLVRTPHDLSVLEVIQAVDAPQRIHTCPLGLASHGKKLCALHRRIDDAMAMVEEAFGESFLSDLLNDPRLARPLCETSPEPTPPAKLNLR